MSLKDAVLGVAKALDEEAERYDCDQEYPGHMTSDSLQAFARELRSIVVASGEPVKIAAPVKPCIQQRLLDVLLAARDMMGCPAVEQMVNEVFGAADDDCP